MRIQFSVNQEEYLKLKALASNYPDISTYCRDASLNERTYETLWETVTEKIEKMKSGTAFTLNQLVEIPPANLGVKLYNNRDVLGIEKIGKSNGSNKFRKR